jgi:MATE family multidrug resistance protein
MEVFLAFPKESRFRLDWGLLKSVLAISFPFMVSSGMFSLKLTFDRLLLSWYSPVSLSASLSAGMTAYLVASVFVGIVGFSSVMVSQLHGEGKLNKIGSCIWQSLIIAFLSGLILIGLSFGLSFIFEFIGHTKVLAQEEKLYFRILGSGALFSLTATALICFWTGRKKIWTVVLINFGILVLAEIISFVLIFGRSGLPVAANSPAYVKIVGFLLNDLASLSGFDSLGIAGSAWGTVLGDIGKTLLLLGIFLSTKNRACFQTIPRELWRPQAFWGLIRKGFGNGIHLLLSIASLTVFNLVVGFYSGVEDLAVTASSIVVSFSSAAMIPLIGLGAAVSLLVGYGRGSQDQNYILNSVSTGSLVALIYMILVFLVSVSSYAYITQLFVGKELKGGELIGETLFLLLWGVFFLVWEGFGLILGGALRGAGDTDYLMKISLSASIVLSIFLVLALQLGWGIELLWIILGFSSGLKVLFLASRYFSGAWKVQKCAGTYYS